MRAPRRLWHTAAQGVGLARKSMNLLVRINLALTTAFALAAVGVGASCYAMLQANAKREADMRIVINNQKATHTAAHALFLAFDSPRLRFAPTLIAL